MALRRIDSHIHIVPDFYAKAAIEAGAGPTRGAYPDWSPDLHLQVMDANDIEFAVNSVVPGVHFLAPPAAKEMARRCNEFASEVAAAHPDRFGNFALVPMHNADDAIEEIGYALDHLGHDGVYMMSSYGDAYLGDAAFDPVLHELNERQAVVFIHPFNSAQQLPGSGHKTALPYPAFMAEYPFDTTRMAAHLLFSGATKRFPKIKFILAHAGGTLPYLAWRLFACQMVSPKFPAWTYEEIKQGLGHFWYDTALSAGPEMMRCLIDMVGIEKVIFGSDWPFGNSDATAVCNRNLSEQGFLTLDEAQAIGRSNALKLFPRLRS